MSVNQKIIEELGARFENNKALYSTIGNLLEELQDTENLFLAKMKLKEIINLTYVVDNISLQIDEQMNKLYENV
jgi:hypothetical protein